MDGSLGTKSLESESSESEDECKTKSLFLFNSMIFGESVRTGSNIWSVKLFMSDDIIELSSEDILLDDAKELNF